jgi:urea-proton symporter
VQILKVSRYVVVAYGVFMGVLAIILHKIGLNLGWVYLFMGILIGSAVFPVYSCLTWPKTGPVAAVAGAFPRTCFPVSSVFPLRAQHLG